MVGFLSNSQKTSLKRKIKKNLFVLLIWNEKRRIEGNREIKKISDEEFIFNKYQKIGRKLNLSSPQRFTEKLQWLKLFYRDETIEECTDKYTARSYIERQGYGYILNDLIAVYDNPDEIDFEDLPDKFVLKLSHGSGWNIICKDKASLNWSMYKHIIKSWIKQNLYIYGREWNYKNLAPKIIIEKYIDSGDGQLTDYKFFCYNGAPHYVQVDRDRFSVHKQTYFDMDWNKLNITTGNVPVDEERPQKFEEMKKIAAELSKPFPHVRIDFYNVDDKIYFGEFTYFDGSGFYSFEPDEYDFEWGSKLRLPEPNHNLELYKKLVSEK